jgi:glycosyltransferase involved in cell wall biosynthesis
MTALAANRPVDSVAMVSEHASPLAVPGSVDSGGQNVYVGALAVELASRGINVVVYTRRDRTDTPRRVALAPGVEIEHVDAGPPTRLARDEFLPYAGEFAANLRHAWERRRPTLVHAHYWMSGLTALEAAHSLQVPVVQTFHALGAQKRVDIERDIATNVDAVAATSAEEVEILARCGAHPRRVRIIPCGVDPRAFAPRRVRARASGMRVLALGRLVERKGVDDVIRALTLVPGVSLVVAGGSGRQDDPDRLRLTDLACRLGVEHRVEWLGPVPHNNVPALLRSCDVVLCVPWYEPFGMVAVEAMACGVPVIVSAVGGIRETVLHEETGLHVPPHDPDRIAAALTMLVSDAELRARLGVAGVDRAAARYTWHSVADEMLDLYGSVVRSAGR